MAYLLLILKDLFGEPGGTRTRDPVLKRHMLYHLSYRPKPWFVGDLMARLSSAVIASRRAFARM